MFALADRLGMTVEQLQKSMTVDEFIYWLAYLEEMNSKWKTMGNLGKLNIVISAVNKTKAVFNQVSQSLNKIKKGVGKALSFWWLNCCHWWCWLCIVALGKQSFAYIDTLGKTSDQLGVSVEFLQAFQIAAEEAGSSSEGANKALLKFSKNIGEAGRGLKTQADLFKNLGVTIRDTEEILKVQKNYYLKQQMV